MSFHPCRRPLISLSALLSEARPAPPLGQAPLPFPVGRPFSSTLSKCQIFATRSVTNSSGSPRVGLHFTSRVTRSLSPVVPPHRKCPFSASARMWARVDHYGALKLPRNATKQQIKAKFYELSKKFHPDAPGGSPEKFHAINDAYSVLGNDESRATYDRSHTPASQRAGGGSFHPRSPEKRRTASGPHAAWGGKPPPGAHWTGRRRVDPNLGGGMGMGGGPAPGMGPWGRKEGHGLGATARQRRHESRLDEEVSGESAVWRFIVITIVLLAVISIGRGFTVSADTGDYDEEEEVELD